MRTNQHIVFRIAQGRHVVLTVVTGPAGPAPCRKFVRTAHAAVRSKSALPAGPVAVAETSQGLLASTENARRSLVDLAQMEVEVYLVTVREGQVVGMVAAGPMMGATAVPMANPVAWIRVI